MMLLSEAAGIMQGDLSGVDQRFSSVEIDTRRLEQDALYFAIHGVHRDGHEFIPQALRQGAIAAVADDRSTEQGAATLIWVEDTTRALGDLARDWRQRFSLPVVGVTGSNGKTTVCRILSTLFAEHIPGIAPQGSFNNQWGVPLTLLKLREQHRSAVIEMGMNHPGELAFLGGIVRPDIALITNAAAAHLAGLKDIAGVARAKGELLEHVAPGGVVVLNRDDQFFAQWRTRAGDHALVSFGLHGEADIRLLERGKQAIKLRVHGREHEFGFQLLGEHNALNAAAAVAVATAAGVPVEAIDSGLQKVRAVAGRLDPIQLGAGWLLIDDSYNANQASMRAAIDLLAEQSGYRILVLGAMGELGQDSAAIHEQTGAYARQKGIDNLLTLVDQGEPGYLNDMAAYLRGFGAGSAAYSDIGSLVDKISSLSARATVLVKGSRFAGMERVVERIKKNGGLPC